MQKNVASQKWRVFAFTLATGAPVTGGAVSITATIAKDYGSPVATNDTNPTEVAHGYYDFDLTQAETDADVLTLNPVSATSGVQVVPCDATLYPDVLVSSRVVTGGDVNAAFIGGIEPVQTAGKLWVLDGDGNALASQTSVDDLPTAIEAAILDEGDATALLAAIAAKVEEFLINDGDSDATLQAIATAIRTELATELARIDAAISSRLATGSYTAPLDAAGVRSAVGMATANMDTQLGAIKTDTAAILVDTGTDGVVVAAGSKGGYSLASTGLDLITATTPTGVASTFPAKMMQLWARFFGRATKSATEIKTYQADGATVATTQAYTSTGDDEDVEAAQ